ncbi:hypothetical protein P43SY_010213 [Pythium insidiosum]|uniref:Reverse transcriptase Ty1/copia-type domain-containing protein n=1 Tax=Pythium insidiosum TaxID=114742 RepID=A0AAD5LT57_PYTIN|nr:hypothetical protein P43SY_010213 [Pythium insidiosum]
MLSCEKFEVRERYVGSGLGYGFEDFVRRYEHAIATDIDTYQSSWTDRMMRNIMVKFMSARPAKYYHDNIARWMAEDPTFSYEDLKRKFLVQYGCRLSGPELNDRMRVPKKLNQTWLDYAEYLQVVVMDPKQLDDCTEHSATSATMTEVMNPVSYQQAMDSPERDEWRKAIQEELDALMMNNTWVVVDRPPDTNVVTSKYVFKVKRDHEGNIERFKLQGNDGYMLLGLYVDDIVMAGSTPAIINRVTNALSDRFQVKTGPATKFLGMNIVDNDRYFYFSQPHVIDEIVKRFNMEHCHS